MYNKAFLIGRITRDPDVRYTPSGIAVTRFSLAINRPFKNKNGENEADFLRVVAWRKLAEICGEFLKKGMLISVDGRLQIDSYEKNGETIFTAEIVADGMQMLERKDHSGQGASAPPPEESMAMAGTEEVPF